MAPNVVPSQIVCLFIVGLTTKMRKKGTTK